METAQTLPSAVGTARICLHHIGIHRTSSLAHGSSGDGVLGTYKWQQNSLVYDVDARDAAGAAGLERQQDHVDRADDERYWPGEKDEDQDPEDHPTASAVASAPGTLRRVAHRGGNNVDDRRSVEIRFR